MKGFTTWVIVQCNRWLTSKIQTALQICYFNNNTYLFIEQFLIHSIFRSNFLHCYKNLNMDHHLWLNLCFFNVRVPLWKGLVIVIVMSFNTERWKSQYKLHTGCVSLILGWWGCARRRCALLTPTMTLIHQDTTVTQSKYNVASPSKCLL